MHPENVILRYLRAQELSQKGIDGERVAAKAAMSRIELSHPGIKQEAARYEQQKKAAQIRAPATRSPTPRAPSADIWDAIFGVAGQAVRRAQGFAETMGNVALGRELAQHVGSSTKLSRSGSLVISIRIPDVISRKLGRLNPIQQRAFRDALHAKLEHEFDVLFGTDE